ncbi:MAG: RcnB family protein [Sphingomicrobium sp.]|nr:RcnB family protein [Sphingomonadales bacterium]
MRKLLFLMLLASTAAPALADPPNRDEWQARGGHADRREETPAPRAERVERPAMPAQAQGGGWRAQDGEDRPQRVSRGGGGGFGAAPQVETPAAPQAVTLPPTRWADHVRGGDGRREGWSRTPPEDGVTNVDGGRGVRRWNGTPDGSVTVDRDGRNIGTISGDHRPDDTHTGSWVGRDGTHSGSWPGRDGTHSGSWTGGDRDHRWSGDWRRDSHYDWRHYRDRNRFVFRIGRYYDPFGYGYRPLSLGFTLFSAYYQPNFWLDEPYRYRLPPVYGPYRWVRYYNDAVLVDIYSGEVVDVIRDFFW